MPPRVLVDPIRTLTRLDRTMRDPLATLQKASPTTSAKSSPLNANNSATCRSELGIMAADIDPSLLTIHQGSNVLRIATLSR